MRLIPYCLPCHAFSAWQLAMELRHDVSPDVRRRRLTVLKHYRVAPTLVDVGHSPAFDLAVLELCVRFGSDHRVFLQLWSCMSSVLPRMNYQRRVCRSYVVVGVNSPATARSCSSQGDAPAFRAAISFSGSTLMCN